MQTRRKPRPFTLEERQNIEKMLQEHKSINYLAHLLDRDYTVLVKEIYRGGGPENYSATHATEMFARNMIRAGSGVKRSFTPEEKALIQKMIEKNKTQRQIRYALNCNYKTIHTYIKNNFPNYKGGATIELTERIESLEEQVSILFQSIKEIKRDQKN